MDQQKTPIELMEELDRKIAELTLTRDRIREQEDLARVQRDRAAECCKRIKDMLNDHALRRSEEYAAAVALWASGFPEPPQPFARYPLGGTAHLLYREHSSEQEYEAYLAVLEEAGFTLYSQNKLSHCLFACYCNETTVLHISFVKTESILRVVADHLTASGLPPKDVICDGTPHTTTPLLMLYGDHMYDAVDCGMGYVYRLTDGSFLIIDSGYQKPDSVVDCLYRRLVEMAEGREIVVSAWIFSHLHYDHIGAYIEFAKKYGKLVTVKRMLHNFPGKYAYLGAGAGEASWARDWPVWMEQTREMFREPVAFYRIYAGQVYRFEGLEVEILLGPDDHLMPYFPTHFNGTSVVFRVMTEGQTHMYLTDADPMQCKLLVDRYGDTLQSDAVQVAHHGFYGGTKEIYDLIKAPAIFWPCPYYDPREHIKNRNRYNDPNWSPVTRRMVKDYGKAVYLQWEGTDILTLPLDLEGKQQSVGKPVEELEKE